MHGGLQAREWFLSGDEMCARYYKQDDNMACTSAGLMTCGRRIAMAVKCIGQGAAYLRICVRFM